MCGRRKSTVAQVLKEIYFLQTNMLGSISGEAASAVVKNGNMFSQIVKYKPSFGVLE